MRRIPNVRVDSLNSVMEFDHVIHVAVDGTVSDGEIGFFAPDLHDYLDADGQSTTTDAELIEEAQRQGWELMTGWTGQHGYRGPVMHSSEFVGGGMAEHILETPGYYVAVVVESISQDEDAETEPVGWVVAYREL